MQKIKEKWGKTEWEEIKEEDKPWEILDSKKHTEGCGNWVMGIMEGSWYDEHWVLYTANESLNIISQNNEVLYVG